MPRALTVPFSRSFSSAPIATRSPIKWHADAIERQLAHQEANEICGAYTHAAEFWQERIRMIRWWADELDRLKEMGRVIKMSA
jgi:hypothetical protein